MDGTWDRVGVGRFPVSYDPNSRNFNAIGKTGGNSSHTHTTGDHTLTINEIPRHRHDFADGGRNLMWDSGLPSYGGLTSGNTVQYTWDCRTNDTGGNGAHNHGNTGSAGTLPPYFVCCMWKRTA